MVDELIEDHLDMTYHTTEDLIRKAKKMDNMLFSNVGSDLKTLAKISVVCGIILGILCAVVMWSTAPILGIVVCIAVVMICAIQSWFLYGFAELLDNVKEMNRTIQEIDFKR